MGSGNSKHLLSGDLVSLDESSNNNLNNNNNNNNNNSTTVPLTTSTDPTTTTTTTVLSFDLGQFQLSNNNNNNGGTKIHSNRHSSNNFVAAGIPSSQTSSNCNNNKLQPKQRKSFDASVLQSSNRHHSPNNGIKLSSIGTANDFGRGGSTLNNNNCADMNDTGTLLLKGYKNHTSSAIVQSLMATSGDGSTTNNNKDGELLNFHGDASIDGKPHLISALICNIDYMIFIVSDLQTNYYIYETSYPRFLQKFFSGEVSVASLPPFKRHLIMFEMISLAFSTQTYNILPESIDNNVTNIKLSLTLQYQAECIDKTVVFKLIKNVPDLTDPENNLIHSTFCKLITGLYRSYQDNNNNNNNRIVGNKGSTTVLLGQAIPGLVLTTAEEEEEETAAVEGQTTTTATNEEDLTSELSPLPSRSEKSEADLVNLGETLIMEETPPPLSTIDQEYSSNVIKVKKSTTTTTLLKSPKKLVTLTMDEEPLVNQDDSMTTSEMVSFLRKLQLSISSRDDIPIDKSKLSLIINTIAKKSQNFEDDNHQQQETNPEVSAFLNAFVKPRSSRSRERPGWKTIANLIRIGMVFKQQSINNNIPANIPGLEEKLHNIDRFEFDVFELNEISRGKPLHVVVTYFLRRFGLVDHFNIDREVLHSFLREVETSYGENNAFHNNIHAADVLQTFMYILDLIGMTSFLTHEELLAVILAAAMHDFKHPGTTNQFQILTSSDLAITYNDKSVLENHHIASFYNVLKQEKFNILKTISPNQTRQIRDICIGLISATDLSFQGSFMNQLQAVFDLSQGPIDLITEKSLVLKLCLKLADTSNTSKPLYLHLSWISRLQKEFFVQGDREKELGMDVSPFMDRNKCNFTKCQNSFIEYVTYPFVALFAKCFKEASIILEYSKLVKDYWSNSVGVVGTFEEIEQMIRNELAKVNKAVTQSHLGDNTIFNTLTTPRNQ